MAASKRIRILGVVLGLIVLAGIVAFNVTRDSRSRVAVQTQNGWLLSR